MFTGPGFQKQRGYIPFTGGFGGGGGGGSPSYHMGEPPMTIAEKRARGMLMGNNEGGLQPNPLAAAFGKPMDRTDTPGRRIAGPDAPEGYESGGFPEPGRPALVGENGPEIIVPLTPTAVIPNEQTNAETWGRLNNQFMTTPGAATFAEPNAVIAKGAAVQNLKGGPLAPKEASNDNAEQVVQIPNADRSIKGMFGDIPYPTRDGVPLNDPSQKWKPGGMPTSDLSVDMGKILRNQLKSGNPGMVQGALSLMQRGTEAANSQDFRRDIAQEQRNLYNQSVQDVNAWRRNDAEMKRQQGLSEHVGAARGYEAAKMLPAGTADFVSKFQDPQTAKGFIAASIKANSKTLDEAEKLQAAKQALAYLTMDPNSGVSEKVAQDIIDHNPTAAGITGFLQHRTKTPVSAPLTKEFFTDPATGKHFVQGAHIASTEMKGTDTPMTQTEAIRALSDARRHRATLDTITNEADRKAAQADIDAEIAYLKGIAYPHLSGQQGGGVNSILDKTKPK